MDILLSQNLRVHCLVCKSSPVDSVMSHLYLVKFFTPYLSKIYFNIILLSTATSFKPSFGFTFFSQNFIRMRHWPTRATCPIHLLLIDLMAIIMLGVSSTKNETHCVVSCSIFALFLLGPNILLSFLFSNNLNLCFSLKVGDQVLN